jgi:hypothetical protein
LETLCRAVRARGFAVARGCVERLRAQGVTADVGAVETALLGVDFRRIEAVDSSWLAAGGAEVRAVSTRHRGAPALTADWLTG